MSKARISKEAYEKYEEALIGLFMEQYASALTDSIDTEQHNAQEMPFPEALDVRCKKLIKKESIKQSFRSAWKTTKRMLRSVAVLAIAVLAVSSFLFISVDAFRERVAQYYIARGDGFWSISSDQHPTQQEPSTTAKFNAENPLLGLIPTDYELISISNANNRRITAVYKNPAGECIRFISIPSTATMQVDLENADVSKETMIMGNYSVISIKNNLTQVAWFVEKAEMTYLIMADYMTESEIIAIAEQIIIQTNN